MTIALIVAGVVLAILGWATTGASGIMQAERDYLYRLAKTLGIGLLSAARTCFYIAGTMAGAQ